MREGTVVVTGVGLNIEIDQINKYINRSQCYKYRKEEILWCWIN